LKARVDARVATATSALKTALARLEAGDKLLLANAPEGFDAFVAGDLARALAERAEGEAAVFVHVARDVTRSAQFREALRFAAPFVEILDLPGWDCQPYDRVSPSAAIASRRMTALARLARSKSSAQQPRVIATTVDCLLQRVPPRARIAADTFSAAPGNVVEMDLLTQWLATNASNPSGALASSSLSPASRRARAVFSALVAAATRASTRAFNETAPDGRGRPRFF